MENKVNGLDIKIARFRVGLRQYELAAKLGISQTRLCEMELGRRAISPEVAAKIEEAINEAKGTRTKA